MEPLSDVTSREELLADVNSPEAAAGRELFTALKLQLRHDEATVDIDAEDVETGSA